MSFSPYMTFSEQQRASLEQLGLVKEQIELLEQLLPDCAFPVRKQPPRTALVKALQAIEEPLMQACNALATLRLDQSDAAREALLRIRLVDAAPFDNGASDGVEVLQRAIDEGLKVLSIAQGLTGTGQHRQRTAMLFPIGKIAGALEEGSRRRLEWSGSMPPQSTLRVSLSGKFPDVVAICYEAIGLTDTNPERAIRTYLESERARRKQRPTA